MLSFVRKYRTAIKELVSEKRYIEAAAAVIMFPALYGFNIIIGETDPDDQIVEDSIKAQIEAEVGHPIKVHHYIDKNGHQVTSYTIDESVEDLVDENNPFLDLIEAKINKAIGK